MSKHDFYICRQVMPTRIVEVKGESYRFLFNKEWKTPNSMKRLIENCFEPLPGKMPK